MTDQEARNFALVEQIETPGGRAFIDTGEITPGFLRKLNGRLRYSYRNPEWPEFIRYANRYGPRGALDYWGN